MSDGDHGAAMASARAHLEDALDALRTGRWPQAVISAGSALAVAPTISTQLVALDALAAGHHALGNHDAACTAAVESLRHGSPDSVPVILDVAAQYAAGGDSGRCTGILEEAHAASPSTQVIVSALASHMHRSGDYPSAVRWYEELDRLDPAGAKNRLPTLDGLRATINRNAQTRVLLDRIGLRLGTLSGQRVVTGPFAGQRLEHDHDFGWVATLIGCYESELHQAIEHAIGSRPHRVINVGCSGGYYAVGFARRLPEVEVIAFDTDASAREACTRAASANGVGDRVMVKSACTPLALQALAGPGTIIFSDCEGYELMLLDPEKVPALRDSSIIVELHDIWVPDLAPRLLRRFVRTHDINHIAMAPRDAERFAILKEAGLTEFEMSLAVSDFRAPGMTWAYLVPRER